MGRGNSIRSGRRIRLVSDHVGRREVGLTFVDVPEDEKMDVKSGLQPKLLSSNPTRLWIKTSVTRKIAKCLKSCPKMISQEK